MRNSSSTPTHWMKVGLAILPGLFAIGTSTGLFQAVFGTSFGHALEQGGFVALCVLVIGMGFARERRIAVWSFPALGILLFPLSAIYVCISWWVRLPFVDGASLIWFIRAFYVLLAVVAGIGGFAVCRVYRQHRTRLPRLAWVLLGLVILEATAGVITPTIADGSANKWAALSVMLPGTLLVIGVILLPVAIGLPLARRNGLLAGLVVVAADFVLVDWILDPAYGLVIWASNPTIVTLVSVIPAVFFLVVSPICVLASRSTRGRVWGLLLPVFVALVSVEIISGSVRPYYLHWLMRAIGSAQFLTALALAAVMYHWIGRQDRLTNIRHGRGALTDDAATVTAGNVLSTM
ncbi:MAG: hypothetical protein CEE40_05160 [Chloroflexi bacterium B3_Chlor]|nr:MAG: hypothetical protein CEE40_05160 [Chloroflexi bacterium B3_Chlor]